MRTPSLFRTLDCRYSGSDRHRRSSLTSGTGQPDNFSPNFSHSGTTSSPFSSCLFRDFSFALRHVNATSSVGPKKPLSWPSFRDSYESEFSCTGGSAPHEESFRKTLTCLLYHIRATGKEGLRTPFVSAWLWVLSRRPRDRTSRCTTKLVSRPRRLVKRTQG